eukprot:scaffold55946_cov30-Prasinocladus_malaysianus.AAC.1
MASLPLNDDGDWRFPCQSAGHRSGRDNNARAPIACRQARKHLYEYISFIISIRLVSNASNHRHGRKQDQTPGATVVR